MLQGRGSNLHLVPECLALGQEGGLLQGGWGAEDRDSA